MFFLFTSTVPGRLPPPPAPPQVTPLFPLSLTFASFLMFSHVSSPNKTSVMIKFLDLFLKYCPILRPYFPVPHHAEYTFIYVYVLFFIYLHTYLFFFLTLLFFFGCSSVLRRRS